MMGPGLQTFFHIFQRVSFCDTKYHLVILRALVRPCVIDRLVYNEKTLQLAGAGPENIFIWSHYKLPPYPNSRMDDFAINNLRIDDSETENNSEND